MFCGVYTALITPFNLDLSIDYKALELIIEKQLANKVSGLVVLGTTSESPTLTDVEKVELINFIIKCVNKKCDLILGIASNNTSSCIEYVNKYQDLDVDNNIKGFLLVNPFYNKPTQQGLYLHFKEIASVSKKPILLYNVMSRCGVALSIDTILKLSLIPNIVGIKECSTDLNYLMQLIKSKPKDFKVLCGEDALFYSYLALCADGCISVASNIISEKMVDIYNNMLAKNYEVASEVAFKYLDFINALFYETNPIPIKTILAYKKELKEVFRLPLCQMEEMNKNKLINMYSKVQNG